MPAVEEHERGHAVSLPEAAQERRPGGGDGSEGHTGTPLLKSQGRPFFGRSRWVGSHRRGTGVRRSQDGDGDPTSRQSP